MRQSIASILFIYSLLISTYYVSTIDAESNRDEILSTTTSESSSSSNDAKDRETDAPSTAIKGGLIVALFILALCFVIFISCLTFWLIGRCKQRRRSEPWLGVFESKNPFPAKSHRFAKPDEKNEVWEGPIPFESVILLPSTTTTADHDSSMSISDRSTKMEVIEDSTIPAANSNVSAQNAKAPVAQRKKSHRKRNAARYQPFYASISKIATKRRELIMIEENVEK